MTAIYTIPSIYIPEKRIITDFLEINNTIPKLISLIQENNKYIYKISPREFEEIIAELFRKQGFNVELTKRTRDGGKDIIAIKKDIMGLDTKYFIECKRYAKTNKINVGIVRALHGIHYTNNGPNKSIIVTTSTFTSVAKKFAKEEVQSEWAMALKDIHDVLDWINDYKNE